MTLFLRCSFAAIIIEQHRKKSSIIRILQYMFAQIITLVAIALFIGISTSSGVGGGTIINLLLIEGWDYTAKESIIVTYVFLMGGALAATMVSANKLNEKGRRLVDYDLVLLTLPMMMSGTIFGTMVNHFISEKVVTIIFIILIIYLLKITYTEMTEPNPPLLPQQADSVHKELIEIDPKAKENQRLSQIRQQEKQLVPVDKIKILMQIYVYTVVLIIIRGGSSFQSIIGLEVCNIGSYVCAILHLLLSYLYSKSIAIKKFQQDLQKESLGYVPEDQQEKMTEEKLRKSMFNGFLAGLLGGSVAVSGGIVLVPLWIRAGIDRDVVVNSTAPLIFFGSSVSFLISVLFSLYSSYSIVLLFFLISFVSTFFIKRKILTLIQKHQAKKLQYAILFVLALVSLLTFLPTQYDKYKINDLTFSDYDTFC